MVTWLCKAYYFFVYLLSIFILILVAFMFLGNPWGRHAWGDLGVEPSSLHHFLMHPFITSSWNLCFRMLEVLFVINCLWSCGSLFLALFLFTLRLLFCVDGSRLLLLLSRSWFKVDHCYYPCLWYFIVFLYILS